MSQPRVAFVWLLSCFLLVDNVRLICYLVSHWWDEPATCCVVGHLDRNNVVKCILTLFTTSWYHWKMYFLTPNVLNECFTWSSYSNLKFPVYSCTQCILWLQLYSSLTYRFSGTWSFSVYIMYSQLYSCVTCRPSGTLRASLCTHCILWPQLYSSGVTWRPSGTLSFSVYTMYSLTSIVQLWCYL